MNPHCMECCDILSELYVCLQVTDAENDEDDDADSRGSHLASQALHVLPFYSLLSADRQAKVCMTNQALLYALS